MIRLLIGCILFNFSYFGMLAQEPNTGLTPLFESEKPLTLRLKYSLDNLRKQTNDSTYMSSIVSVNMDGTWKDLEAEIRARGNFRKNNCYHVPLKLKIDPKEVNGTPFEGNRKLKLVVPCKQEPNANDYVVKEYLAYKMYEVISPYHFRTRLVDVEYVEERKRRNRIHQLKGILIEDIDDVTSRLDAEEIKQNIHPLQQDDLFSIRNSFFQYLIGNTDFSARSRHNDKLIIVDDRVVYIPYDFDMSGLVNASYATVSGLDNISPKITSVTQRIYKGYRREESLMKEERLTYLNLENEIMKTVENARIHFESEEQFRSAKDFVKGFFLILKSDQAFKIEILDRARQ